MFGLVSLDNLKRMYMYSLYLCYNKIYFYRFCGFFLVFKLDIMFYRILIFYLVDCFIFGLRRMNYGIFYIGFFKYLCLILYIDVKGIIG